MLLLLPVLATALWAWGWRRRGAGLDDAFVRALLLASLVVAVGTEGASALKVLRPDVMAGAWSVMALAALTWAPRNARAAASGNDEGLPWWAAMTAGLALGFTAWQAWAYPPNSWDAMTYHLPRVRAWIAQGSVDFYPTHVSRQLWMSPYYSYAQMHARLLGGDDAAVNLVAWLYFAGCLAAASALARACALSRFGRGAAVAFAATLPMAWLQANNVQNDGVAAFFLLAAAASVLRAWVGTGKADSWVLGAAVGLGILTKGTMLVYLAPVLLTCAAACLARNDARSWRNAVAAAAVALALNAPHAWRNGVAFASPWGNVGEYPLANADHSPAAWLSLAARNAALHGTTPWPGVGMALRQAVTRVSWGLGVDPAGAATSYNGGAFFVPRRWNHPEQAGNPWHFLWLAASLVALAAAGVARDPARIPPRRTLVATALFVVGGAVLFVGAFTWQPWHSRLHLPLFLLAAPLAGWAADRHKAAAACALPWALAYAMTASATNPLRPWPVPPVEEALFLADPAKGAAFRTVAAHLRASAGRCADVGLIGGNDDWEYPLWRLVSDASGGRVTFRHVDGGEPLHGPVGRAKGKEPCALVDLGRGGSALADGGPFLVKDAF